MRLRLLVVGTAGLLVALGFLLPQLFRAKPAGKQWLSISQPVFGNRTNADGVLPTVLLAISNVGPRGLVFNVAWLECRTRTELTLLTTNEASVWLPPLPSEAVTNLTLDLAQHPPPGEELLFCCQFNWMEVQPPLWRVGRKLEPGLSRIMEIFDSQWLPPWESASGTATLSSGTAFLSNVGVPEYFKRVYGLTRAGWLEERRRNEEERKRWAAAIPAPSERAYRGRWPTAEEEIRFRAGLVFSEYCRSTTEVVEQVTPSAPTNATSWDR